MMRGPKALILVLGTLLTQMLRAQVVAIPNAGFEEAWAVNPDDPWPPHYWYAPEPYAEPLLFHTMFDQQNFAVSVPQNIYGYSYGHDNSNGYVGVTTYSTTADMRKYLWTTLNLFSDTLQAGTDYCVSLWMRLADSSMYKTDLFEMLPGVYPGNMDGGADSTTWLSGTRISFNTSNVGKGAWTQVQATYTPMSDTPLFPWTFILGNFQTDSQINATQIDSTGAPLALYWIDDIAFEGCATSIHETGISPPFSAIPSVVPAGSTVDLHTRFISGTNRELVILDAVGRLVRTLTWSPGSASLTFSCEGLSPGSYHIQLSGDQPLRSELIIY